MKRFVSALSTLLAILSACTAFMGVAMMGQSLLTPQSRLPRLHEDGPSLIMRLGAGGVAAAVVLGVLSYALGRLVTGSR
jgi:hypothetical protein